MIWGPNLLPTSPSPWPRAVLPTLSRPQTVPPCIPVWQREKERLRRPEGGGTSALEEGIETLAQEGDRDISTGGDRDIGTGGDRDIGTGGDRDVGTGRGDRDVGTGGDGRWRKGRGTSSEGGLRGLGNKRGEFPFSPITGGSNAPTHGYVPRTRACV
ncbi:hypothetical protein H6P81_003910 [Aristolochia fimbriata]|uniref:Uncharacterized protein n=1 Tax=Aristolochia fimbriata TaxID=158543 RepID=A0AAV7FGV5_ARIFI|nr:hypothetical protein H6P81_003910 [Aristolochia fimbriata]